MTLSIRSKDDCQDAHLSSAAEPSISSSAASISGKAARKAARVARTDTKASLMHQDARPAHRQLLYLFLVSKCIVFGVALVSAALVPPGNTSTDLVLCRHDAHPRSRLDALLKQFLTPFIRWDAVHFMAIARHGHVFENQFAFMPAMPYAARLLAKPLSLCTYISPETAIGCAALFIANASHYLAALTLHALTALLFPRSAAFPMLAATLFTHNPAAIQLSTFYAEAPFALLSFLGMLLLAHAQRSHGTRALFHRLAAALVWMVAGLTRANGIVLAGYFLFDTWIFLTTKPPAKPVRVFGHIALTLLCCLLTVSGFHFFTAVYARNRFCTTLQRPWCASLSTDWRSLAFFFVPSGIYSHVQRTYWNVGLFRYYTLSQIPNFLLATPMALLCFAAIATYIAASPRRFLTLGAVSGGKRAAVRPFTDDAVLAHVYLLAFMLCYTLLVAHVQIITRIFTFQPAVYWYLAHLLDSPTDSSRTASQPERLHYQSPRRQRLILTTIGLYGLLATVLFATHYPPA